MKIKLEINPKYTEMEVRICSDADSEAVRKVYRTIKNAVDTSVMAHFDGEVIPIGSSDIIRIYAQNQRVFVTTAKGDYRLHERLYELEEMLDNGVFLRISNSEIVNLKKISFFDQFLCGQYLQNDATPFL